MKKTMLILLCLLLWAGTEAQDKIITIQNDTIECRILSVGAERITYEQNENGNYTTGKSIAIADVLQYFRKEHASGMDGFYRDPARQKPQHRYLISLQGGLSQLTSDFANLKNSMNTTSGVDDYFDDLKSAYYLGAEEPVGLLILSVFHTFWECNQNSLSPFLWH
ncbi:MAG: hypothetical protein ACK5JD_15535 [Mangrovibacterium sp.]